MVETSKLLCYRCLHPGRSRAVHQNNTELELSSVKKQSCYSNNSGFSFNTLNVLLIFAHSSQPFILEGFMLDATNI